MARLATLPHRRPRLFLAAAVLAWIALYRALAPASTAIVAQLPPVATGRLADAIAFFLYDAPKVLLLLVGVVFVMAIVNASFTPERTRALLARRGGLPGHVLAASLGVVTPFCSCSAVPLFIGFLRAGVPLGITFSFLIAAPLVNEVALALLLGLFGWRIALLYLTLGMAIAVSAGFVLGRLRLEPFVEDWVRAMPRVEPAAVSGDAGLAARVDGGFAAAREVVGRVWPYLVAGIGVGAFIHGYVPADAMAAIMGRDAWWSVPIAVLLGVPMYANAAGILPVIEALLAKGAALGTALAFMMSVIALSLPEMIILRKVLKPRLIATFVAVVATGILVVGFLFNVLLA